MKICSYSGFARKKKKKVVPAKNLPHLKSNHLEVFSSWLSLYSLQTSSGDWHCSFFCRFFVLPPTRQSRSSFFITVFSSTHLLTAASPLHPTIPAGWHTLFSDIASFSASRICHHGFPAFSFLDNIFRLVCLCCRPLVHYSLWRSLRFFYADLKHR